MTKAIWPVVALCVSSLVSGCQATGENLGSNVYHADQVNSRQEAKTITIVAIMPAKVEIDNSKQKKTAQTIGLILGAVAGAAVGHSLGDQSATNMTIGAAGGAAAGAAAGSMVDDKVLVDGVSITYNDSGKIFSSAQVGKMCEYVPGLAVVIATNASETRIQPNAICPVEKES